MNDEQRAALVQWIREELHLAWSAGNGLLIAQEPHQRTMLSLEQEIDRLLADRAATVAEPDAETVEAVAKAIHRRGPASGQDFRYRPETEQEMYRDMARAALITIRTHDEQSALLGPRPSGEEAADER